MKKYLLYIFLAYSGILQAQTPPKLVVQIVVDQLRGDLIDSYRDKFKEKGFNYLLEHGINFNNAHHPHANTVTCVGHATIATGSYPALHGVIANEWYDRGSHRMVYCMEDLSSTILASNHGLKEVAGRSPRQLLVSTLSDEIVLAKKGRAYGVSLKDRSAITLAGHAGVAYWYDRENGGFISSRYYLQRYPEWVKTWNKNYSLKNETWSPSQSLTVYKYANAPSFAHRFPAFGQHFPHHTGNPADDNYFKFLSMTPVADEITADFALQLLKNEKLGKSTNDTDYLAISFSAVDTIGHQFGPNSIESEDNLLRLDATLNRFFTALDEEIGLDNVLIVLSADHGVSDSGAYLQSHRMPMTSAYNEKALRLSIEQTLFKQFNLPTNTLQAIDPPYIYLDHKIIHDHRLKNDTITSTLVKLLNTRAEIYQAYALTTIAKENSWIGRKVARMAYLKRAGDIYIVPPPYQYPDEMQEQRVGHGTPWNYDSYVPLIFARGTLKGQTISRPTSTTDIAATIASLLRVKAPSGCVGKALTEVIEANR